MTYIMTFVARLITRASSSDKYGSTGLRRAPEFRKLKTSSSSSSVLIVSCREVRGDLRLAGEQWEGLQNTRHYNSHTWQWQKG